MIHFTTETGEYIAVEIHNLPFTEQPTFFYSENKPESERYILKYATEDFKTDVYLPKGDYEILEVVGDLTYQQKKAITGKRQTTSVNVHMKIYIIEAHNLTDHHLILKKISN